MTVYERLLSICKEKGISITSLCLKATGNKGNLQTWKNNNGYMKSNYLLNCAKILDCSTDYLLGRTNNPNPTIVDADFFRILLSDDGLNFLKKPLSSKIDEYGYENLQRDLNLSFADIKTFLTADISAGTKVLSMLDKLLIVLDANIFELFSAGKSEELTQEDIRKTLQPDIQIAAYGGKSTIADYDIKSEKEILETVDKMKDK